MQPAVLLVLLGATMVAGEWARRALQHRGQRQTLVFPVAPHLSWTILGEKEGSVEGFSLLLQVLNFFSSLVIPFNPPLHRLTWKKPEGFLAQPEESQSFHIWVSL